MAGYHTRWVRPAEPTEDPERIAIREAAWPRRWTPMSA
jgi:hypothetical protein